MNRIGGEESPALQFLEERKPATVGSISAGSARVSHVGDRVLAIVDFSPRLFRRAAETSAQDACATRTKEGRDLQ
jgi:hypothetical protein